MNARALRSAILGSPVAHPLAPVRPHEQTTFDFLARLLDALTIAATLGVAVAMYRESWSTQHSLAAAAAATLFHLAGQALGLYGAGSRDALWASLRRVGIVWGVTLLGLTLVAFVTKTSDQYSRVIGISWALLAPGAMASWRSVLYVAIQKAREKGYDTRRVVIAGVSEVGTRLARHIAAVPAAGLRFCGYYDDRDASRLSASATDLIELRGEFDDLIAAARQRHVEAVYIALPAHAQGRIRELFSKLSDTTVSVYLANDVTGCGPMWGQWSRVGDVPVIGMAEDPFDGVDGWIKRLEDMVLGSLIVALTAVPMAVIALGVKLTSRGPVFFRQRRYGLNGEEIRVLKFRTMTVCEDGAAVTQATKNDARITRFGAWLRRTSLDEFPQFLQVVTGAMSLVGPRPHAVAHNEQYRRLIPGYMLRHKVKPGVTGWAQVNGWRGETDSLDKMEGRVAYDLAYMRDWTLSLDLKIIVKTILTVLRGRNAY